MKPKEKLSQQLDHLQTVRQELFQLYTEATQETNKNAVLAAQLDVMGAIGKIKKILGIKEVSK